MTAQQIAEYVEDGARVTIDHDAEIASVFITVKIHHISTYCVLPEAKAPSFLRDAADEIASRIK